MTLISVFLQTLVIVIIDALPDIIIWIVTGYDPASRDELKIFHNSEYIDFLISAEEIARRDSKNKSFLRDCEDFGVEDDCPLFPGLSRYIRFIAGGTLQAARYLVDRKTDVAIHWDGGRHHAKREKASGFCYINDTVLGIIELHKGFRKVLYLDVDIHHGDGVEEAFEFSSKTMTLSFHVHYPGFFPGTGGTIAGGKRSGKNHAINVPLQPGLCDTNLALVIRRVGELALKNYKPEVIVLCLGTDGLQGDPLVGECGWNLSSYGLRHVVEIVLEWNLPLLLLGGGGYDSAAAARTWTGITAAVLGKRLATNIPEHGFFHKYGPDFQVTVPAGNRKDDNNVDGYLERIITEAEQVLNEMMVISPSS